MTDNTTSWQVVVCGLLLTIAATPSQGAPAEEESVDLNPEIVSGFIQNHCQKCHGPKEQEGELRLDNLSLKIGNSDDGQRWLDVYLAMKGAEMPPEDEPQPPKGELAKVLKHLKSTVEEATLRFGPGSQYKAGDIKIAAAGADEPKVESFNRNTILAAAKYLDDGAIAWTRSRKCITCHTNGTYMVERPVLTQFLGKPSEEVLRPFQRVRPAKAPAAYDGDGDGDSNGDGDGDGDSDGDGDGDGDVDGDGEGGDDDASAPGKDRKRPAYRIIWQTLGLSQWDKHVTGKTTESTQLALRSMLMQQREDGSWLHYQGVRELPHISTDFELAVRAAWATASAPGWLDSLEDEEQLNRVGRMKTYLRKHKPRNDYELALKLQLANFMPDAVSTEHRDAAIAMLRGEQQADGGWSTRSMSAIDNWGNWHPKKDNRNLEMLRGESDAEKSASDPYMTGFAIVLLRESGVPKTDEQIQGGIAWLKTNQRQSGRWWMKSMHKETYHFTTYMGTAQALKALALCGELDLLRWTTVSPTATPSTDVGLSN